MVGATASALMGVLEPILGNLSSVLLLEFDKLKNVHGQIEFLRDELCIMNATLETMSESDEQNPQTQVWMNQLRELCYDIEDRIETMLLGQDNNSDGFIKKLLNMVTSLKKRYDTSNQLKELKERALEVSDRRKRYKLDPSATSPNFIAIDPRLPGLFEEAEKLVGIDSQRESILKLLTNGTDVYLQKVLSIVGFGGIGKTTLANQLFHKIKSEFECSAFVSISRNYNATKVLKDILLQFCESDQRMQLDLSMRTLEYKELVQRHRDFIENRRYLIVIDDIWSRQAWTDIQCAFPQNRLASRVITTTRIEDVAAFCSLRDHDFVYSMKQLSANDSQKLFLARIFKDERDWPQELKQVTMDILRKCDGLPLAIVTTASMLATKPTSRQEWEKVRNSMNSAMEQNRELEIIHKILFLSYSDLPHNLKTCFLYLSQFPEDCKIDRSLLMRWVAEGFITIQHGQCLDKVASSYFNELVNRNMIQAVDINSNGTPKACRVHDIMLDLIINIAAKENFSTVMNGGKVDCWANKIRRLSVQGNFWQGANISNTRSLSSFGPVKKLPPLWKFQLLRVLDIEGCSAPNSGDLESIGTLVHLRYLRLSDTRIKRLEADIGRLKSLKTLDLRFTMIEHLPTGVTQLRQLVHLFVPYTVELPKGIGNLECLEELSELNAIKTPPEVLQELERLDNLKVLNIRWNPADGFTDPETMKQSLCNSFCKLGQNSLRSLYIQGGDFCCMDFVAQSWCPPPKNVRRFVMEGMVPLFSKMPEWIFSMLELVSLQIWVDKLKVEDVHLLQTLPSLVYLNLDTRESIKETVSISCNGFRSLKLLLFCLMDSNGGWGLKFEAGSAPRIQEINLAFAAHDCICSNGVAFDTGISHLSTLKHISVFIYCQQATTWELEVAESAIRSAAAILPNHPVPGIYRRREDEMVTDDREREGTSVSESNQRTPMPY